MRGTIDKPQGLELEDYRELMGPSDSTSNLEYLG